VNTFLADGGDGFTQLRQGTGRVTTSIDLDAFVAHLQANPGVTPPATDRITVG
jgi:5'-nucleotidase